MVATGAADGTLLPEPVGQLATTTSASSGPPAELMETPSADGAAAEHRLAELLAEVDALTAQQSRTVPSAANDHDLGGLVTSRSAQACNEVQVAAGAVAAIRCAARRRTRRRAARCCITRLRSARRRAPLSDARARRRMSRVACGVLSGV